MCINYTFLNTSIYTYMTKNCKKTKKQFMSWIFITISIIDKYTITNPLSSMYYFICNLKISKNNNSKMKMWNNSIILLYNLLLCFWWNIKFIDQVKNVLCTITLLFMNIISKKIKGTFTEFTRKMKKLFSHGSKKS